MSTQAEARAYAGLYIHLPAASLKPLDLFVFGVNWVVPAPAVCTWAR